MFPSGYTTATHTSSWADSCALRFTSNAAIHTQVYINIAFHCLGMELLDHKYLVFKTSPPPVSKVMLCAPRAQCLSGQATANHKSLTANYGAVTILLFAQAAWALRVSSIWGRG